VETDRDRVPILEELARLRVTGGRVPQEGSLVDLELEEALADRIRASRFGGVEELDLELHAARRDEAGVGGEQRLREGCRLQEAQGCVRYSCRRSRRLRDQG
jgi:hypothetical protein